MQQTIGFIGCGNMAQAMIGGMLESGIVQQEQLLISAHSAKTTSYVEETFGISTTLQNREVVSNSKLLFLAVKPHKYKDVIEEVRSAVSDETVVISIAPGISFQDLTEMFNREMKFVQAMPNTPSLVQQGMTALSSNELVTEEELSSIVELFQSFGKAEVIPESMMGAIPSISGSSPAYVYMMIEAMADGGVKQGLSRDQSNRLAAQAVLGAAQMVLESDKHPAQLKDDVCSPGGATIEAVSKLEESGFRKSILAAMESCTAKVNRMSD
ncbi:pyrroline-5-carboxylate reductase [Pontibacillus halophilus JSM 076056 = DSM 19796]|uniref:Pyrroline-5-carboxylate reductase n=1 Tax=Pontibacillus halophilus JSM 076056 = DSM 19796 TaxID=1385510 RepID=A0A0A5GG06_9BACI|nr:pyrroline-5-carboxylate reductase [Pontibacillus halophilus]KGX90939.1 pyrroline-5-carboxylate reductase [Pontibacillus halophilus JSM 076056 = DSM 19796]